ncbi:MAG: TetR family transcriptional regulator [Rhodospirillales bacterium CG15_BIG_FIL_POST_REV_8_21_14_020_66_15]|nr:MAG: TetR family transcriptional regulator [Rhodospirillales bacterium CG15_BIG_FIL_POST_REV_8_21_14_020_66_15]
MTRTREFDPDAALDKAMHLFWERGFAHTSMADLVRHTGVSRYGLYGTFGNKDEIYRRALMRYIELMKDEMQKDLRRPGAGRAELETYFRHITGVVTSDEGRKGCMVCNTAAELAPHDPEMAAHLKVLQENLRAMLEDVIANGQKAGDIRTDIAARDLAMLLFAMEQGMAALHRGGTPVEALLPCFDTFLKIMDG